MRRVMLDSDINVIPVSAVNTELIYAGIYDNLILIIIYNSELSVYQTNWLYSNPMRNGYGLYENVALEEIIKEMIKDEIQVYEFEIDAEFGEWIVNSIDQLNQTQ